MHKEGRQDKEKARSHLTRSFLVVSKTELSSIKALLLLGCWCGERRGSQLSKQKQGLAGGEALGRLLLPAHFFAFECPQI